MKLYRSRLFTVVGQRSLLSHLSAFSKDFFSETAEPNLILIFICNFQAKQERLFIYLLGQMIEMAAMSLYGRTLKSLLKSHWDYCLESFGNLEQSTFIFFFMILG